MRVLVDTSAWADFFNGHSSPHAEALARLLREEADVLTCGLVAAEVLQGIRREESLAALQRHFREMEWLAPREPETYLEAANLYRQLRAEGVTIRSISACIIAKLAEENDALLLSKDRDLQRIVDSKLLEVRTLPLA
jgi:predicted nucleic acid-binding protein